ncbi:MAG: hypothetical protein ABI658_13130 [Acidimicrobiales bacterium]
MSVVEKPAPRWRPVAIGVGVVTALIGLIAVVLTVANGSNEPDTRSSPTTRAPSNDPTTSLTSPQQVTPLDADLDRAASYRVYLHRLGVANTLYVYGYIDAQRGEIRHFDETQVTYGSVVGRVGDQLILQGAQLRIIDRDFAGAATSIGGDDFVGVWRDHVIVAEYFPERTTFHEYRVDGTEARSVALVGRRPDVMGGVVRDSVVLERAGRLLSLGLADATVRPFGVGHLLGVGGDRIYFTACTDEGACTITEATLDRPVRTTPIGDYVTSGSERAFADVAPNGLAIYLYDYRRRQDVVLALGTTVVLPSSIDTRSRAWAPTGDWIFSFEQATGPLEAVDFRRGQVVTIPLSSADAAALAAVAVW